MSSQPVAALSTSCFVLSREATHINCVFFRETLREHANHYTTNAVVQIRIIITIVYEIKVPHCLYYMRIPQEGRHIACTRYMEIHHCLRKTFEWIIA
jgi:hypothetical protein